MADGEADPFCVALAATLGGGLVVGMDSDFAVLCADGYGGYVPIDEMIWQTSGEEATPVPNDEDMDGFQAVVTKQRTKRKSSGLIPPSCNLQPGELSLALSIYHPHTLATHLRLSPALLPLFSALVGNDFSNPAHGRKFFENHSSSVERVWKVARAVSAASVSGIKKGQGSARPSGQTHGSGDTVLDVIHAAVSQLLVRPDMIASGEVDKIVHDTVDAALECTIPPVEAGFPLSASETCVLHPLDECPLALALVGAGVSSSLLRGYRAGRVGRRLLSALTTGIVLPKLFLEDPDQRSCALVTRSTWNYIWAILAAGGHIPLPSPLNLSRSRVERNAKSPFDDETDSRLEDDSELISVVEEFTATEPSVCSDPAGLASELVERLRGLAGSWGDMDEDKESTERAERSLVHYARRGLKLLPEPVVVERLADMVPGHSLGGGSENWTRAERARVFLEGMKSNTGALRGAFQTCFAAGPGSIAGSEPGTAMDLGTLIWVCVLRCVVQASAELAGNGNGNGNGSAALVGKWKKTEARAFVGSLVVDPQAISTDATPAPSAPSADAGTIPDLPPLDTRTIQRVAQLLYAFDAGARLTEVVYLFEGGSGDKATDTAEADGGRPGGEESGLGRDVIGQTVRMFSGLAVHAAASASSAQVDESIWSLVCEGLEDGVWAYEPERGKAKAKSKSKSKSDGKAGGKAPGRGAGFGVLAFLESE